MDIFNMFKEAIPESLQKQAEETKKKEDRKKKILSRTAQKSEECGGEDDSSKKPTIPETEKKIILLPTAVYYARKEDIINPEEFSAEIIVEGKVSKEDIRRLLEESFPELSKERTIIEYDEEENRVFPIVKATTKGAHSLLFFLRR